MAIEDKAEAYDAFRNATRTYYPSYVAKRVFNQVPDFIKRPAVRAGMTVMPTFEELAMTRIAANTPGWQVIQ